MAFKITKIERAAIDKELTKLTEERRTLEAAYEKFNEIVGPALEELNGAITTYNQVKADAGSEITSVKDRLEGEADDKSDRWQESERGQCIREWIDSMGQFADEFDTEIEEVTVEEPSFEEDDMQDRFDQEVPEEPDCY